MGPWAPVLCWGKCLLPGVIHLSLLVLFFCMWSLFLCWFKPVARVPVSSRSSLWKGRSNRSISITAYIASRLLAWLLTQSFVCNSVACSSLLEINLIHFLMAKHMVCFFSVSFQGTQSICRPSLVFCYLYFFFFLCECVVPENEVLWL